MRTPLVLVVLVIFLKIKCHQSQSSCSDKKRGCWKWKGYCQLRRSSYYNYMKVNCKRTCGDCKLVVNTNCNDSLHSCASWARQNYCIRTPLYMKKFCRASCGFCGVTPTKRTTRTKQITDGNCHDKDSRCRYWNRRGYCYRRSRYYSYVSKLCPITCQVNCVKTTTIPLPPTDATTTTVSIKQILTECGEDKRFSRPSQVGTIVNGNDAPKHSWIWQAALVYYDVFECGGTLISPRHVLTAAHCLEYRNEDGLEVVLGDHLRDRNDSTEQKRKVDKIWIHKDYDSDTVDNDIGIIRLTKPVTLNAWVGLACLPKATDSIKRDRCFATGWGKIDKDGTSVNIMQEGKLPMIDETECKKRNVNSEGQTEITNNMFCAGTKTGTVSGCQGDSGGPYVCLTNKKKWVLQGAVSWGSSECDNKQKYTVFTKVTNYLDWIEDILYGKI